MQFSQPDGFDAYKCSFSYSFKVSLEKENESSEFLLTLYDWKGGMPSYKFYGAAPKDEVLMQQNLKYVVLELLEYLIITFRTEHTDFNTNFYRFNQAGFLVYGFDKGRFFHHQHDAYEEYVYELFQDEINSIQGQNRFLSKMT